MLIYFRSVLSSKSFIQEISHLNEMHLKKKIRIIKKKEKAYLKFFVKG